MPAQGRIITKKSFIIPYVAALQERVMLGCPEDIKKRINRGLFYGNI